MTTISDPVEARPAGAGSAETPWLLAAAATLAVFAAVLFAPQVLNDGDTYWHLAAGEWMVAHGRVLHQDVFSYTWAGRPWGPHEWLSEVLMALAFRAGGWSGVLVLFAAAMGGAMAVLARRAASWLGLLGVALMLFLAFAVMSPSLLVRPHLLALPLLALWTAELLAARDAGRSPALWLAPLMMLWANLHGSYVFGFVVMAPLALEALVAGPDRWRVVRGWGLVGVAALAAAFVNPLGVEGVVQPLSIMTMGTLNAIVEWRAADFSHVTPFELSLLATLFVCLGYGVRVPPLRLALLLLVLHMALQHQRHQIVLAVIGALVLAEPLGRAFGRGEAAPPRLPRGAWIAAAVALVLLAGVRLAVPAVRGDGVTTPASALAHVPPALRSRPVLNSYGFGGYLIFEGVRPFIDGRADMYGDDFFARQQAIVAGDPAAVDRAFAQYGVAWTILAPREPLVRVLDMRPGWRRLYADRYAVVHVRSGP